MQDFAFPSLPMFWPSFEDCVCNIHAWIDNRLAHIFPGLYMWRRKAKNMYTANLESYLRSIKLQLLLLITEEMRWAYHVWECTQTGFKKSFSSFLIQQRLLYLLSISADYITISHDLSVFWEQEKHWRLWELWNLIKSEFLTFYKRERFSKIVMLWRCYGTRKT